MRISDWSSDVCSSDVSHHLSMVLSDEGDDELARVPKRRNDVLLGPAGMLSGSKGSNGYSLNNRNVRRNLFSDISHLSPRPNAGIKRRRSVRLEREVKWRTRLLREGTQIGNGQ